MELFLHYLLIPFATMVVTSPIPVQRENVLSFLNDALGTTTEKTIPAKITACRNPPNKPVKEQDSEETDVSEEKSSESFDTSAFTGPEVSDKNGGGSRDAVKGLNSDEIVISEVTEKDKAPSRITEGAKDLSRELVQDQGNREHSGGRTDLNSGEGMTLGAQEAEVLSGKQGIPLSGEQVTGSFQRKATPGRGHGSNGMLAPGRSRELLDQDSLEDNNDRPAPVGNRGDADYDETREYLSSETYPIAPPEHMPNSFSVPAKSRAS